MHSHPPLPLPSRIGPIEFAEFGGTVAVRCPQDFPHILQRAGGLREPGTPAAPRVRAACRRAVRRRWGDRRPSAPNME